MGLRSKILTPIVVLIVVLGTTFTGFVVWKAGGQITAKQDEKSLTMAKTIAQFALPKIQGRESESLPDFLNNLIASGVRDDLDLVYIVLYKGTGQSEKMWGKFFDVPQEARSRERLQWEEPLADAYLRRTSEHEGYEHVIEYLCPIADRLLQAAGSVKVGISYQRVWNQKMFMIGILAGMGLLITIVGCMIAQFLTKSITGPVQNLISGIEALGRGNTEHRIHITSDDELGALGASFNQMAEKMRLARSKMENYSRDLEEMVRARTAELRKAYDELKRLDELKDTFLSSVSHELRTPLTSISSFAEILLQYDDEDEATREEFLGIIKREAERLSRLIDDVLDLAKIEAGMVNWKVDRHDLKTIVEDAIKTIKPLTEAGEIGIDFSYPPRIPQVLGDRDRLSQVIMNLLSNARKFTNAGDTLQVRLNVENGFLRCEVEDHGVGIAPDDIEKVFQKFQQAENQGDNLVDKPKGTGLGLPISRDIIEFHGGKLWAESELGKGSTFIFTIPTADHPDPRPISRFAESGNAS